MKTAKPRPMTSHQTGRRGGRATPARLDFMDADMRLVWERMTAEHLGSLRLYGGTAMALYRNHRKSTDFDFATPCAEVDMDFVARIPWLSGCEMRGGPGMVDVLLPAASRAISMTFMECGHLIPAPTRSPLRAANGVAVAHPIDLIAAKVQACFGRGELRDYEDLAEAARAWPAWCRTACLSLPGRKAADVAGVLSSPPQHINIDRTLLERLQAFASKLVRIEHGWDG